MSYFNRASSAIVALDRRLIPVEDLANLLASIAIFLMMVLGVVQIVMRTVFNSPVAGYIDMVELSMASMAFLGAAYCQRLGTHIRMDLVVSHLSGRKYWALEIFSTLIGMFIIAVLVWYGAGHFWRAYSLGDTTIDAEFVVWPSKLLVPIAFSIWFLRLTVQLAGSIRLFIDPSAEPVGIVSLKDVVDQAQEEIHEVMGDEAPDVVLKNEDTKQ
ncbi:TRAP transporter small permease subunit [Candidatus Halocynthiibacter alkanivorans]|jgi:TRAP-type C4-dicarboxylate transport system permease small subunit|uniref:TRAP transporter small permease subunit n=1 Tax=Candidatus Halocynthiibacter alkanivorans TaxID=2267619 RepID=UPI000DF49012|nr:TRAP transporter small permease [Candidatus Halocynthiibacter alkanivorans]